MDKVFVFIKSLHQSFFDVLGFPTIKFYSCLCEVQFNSSKTIHDLSIFDLDGFDEFRFFPNDGVITYVFTFYCD